ncbi:MAG TPA: hypothetical protein VGS20_10220 [Candidatus Acidoferrales bacterium]|nr:hypothetical protein [Candidatus Acidoferrales bacterium]
MRINPGDAWRWITGHKASGFWAVFLAGEELARLFVTRARKRDEAEIFKVLRMGGSGPAWGMTEEQVAMQCGWEPKKARAALQRLAKAGQVREKDQRWYLIAPVTAKLGA